MRLVFHIVGALVGLALAAGAAKAILDVGARNSFDVEASYAGVTRLVVDQQGGAVQLRGVPAGRRLRVRAHVRQGFDEPARRAVRSGGTLELRARCGAGVLSPHCSVDYAIAVPAGTIVVVDTGTGPIEAHGLSGSTFTLNTGTGPVLASGMRADTVSVSTGTGPIDLALASPARTLQAQSGTGPILLRVPDTPYALDVSSASGGVSTSPRLRRDAGARHRISADSATGPVRIDVTE